MVIKFDKSKLVRSVLISAAFWVIPLLLEKIIYILGLSTFIWAVLSSDVSSSNTIVLNTVNVISTIESLIKRIIFSKIINEKNINSKKLLILPAVKLETVVDIKTIKKMNLVELVMYSQDKIDIKNIKGRATKTKIISLLTSNID